MAKIDVTKIELVWPGKYNEDGALKEVPRVNLPFQVIKTINEGRADTLRISRAHSDDGRDVRPLRRRVHRPAVLRLHPVRVEEIRR